MFATRLSKGLALTSAIAVSGSIAIAPAYAEPSHENDFSALGEIASGSIDVGQDYISNVEGGDRSVEYQLTRVTPEAPMPDGATGDVYKFKLNGSEDKKLEIEFRGAGTTETCEYTLKCVSPDKEFQTLDKAEYKVTVEAIIGSEHSRVTPIIYDESGAKVEKAKWNVEYRYVEPPKAEVPKMGDYIIDGVYIVALAIGAVVIVSAVKRRREDDMEE